MARIVLDASEVAGSRAQALLAGWSINEFISTAQVYSATPRVDVSGNGGTYYWRCGGNDTYQARWRSPEWPVSTDHYFVKAGIRYGPGVGTGYTDLRIYTLTSAFADVLYIGSDNLGAILAWDTSGVLATSSFTPTVGVYYLLEAEVYHHASAGYVKVWIDGVQIIDYSGAVAGAGTARVTGLWGGGEAFFDDVGVNSLTLRYDGGAGGVPVVGNTLTAGGGQTATIQGYEGDATSGVLTIAQPSGTFADNDTLSDGGTFSAVVDAPTAAFVGGLEPNSGRMNNEFIVAIKPTGAGALSGLTPTGSANNWENVDDIPAVTSAYNEATAAGQEDTYTDNASTQIPANTEVTLVAGAAFAQSSLTGIDGINLSIRSSGGTVYYSDRFALGSSYGFELVEWNTRPDTDTGWTRTGIVTDFPQIGVKFVV